MQTIELPAHTLAYLLQRGHALHLVPMEPQPPNKISDGREWDWNERDGVWILGA